MCQKIIQPYGAADGITLKFSLLWSWTCMFSGTSLLWFNGAWNIIFFLQKAVCDGNGADRSGPHLWEANTMVMRFCYSPDSEGKGDALCWNVKFSSSIHAGWQFKEFHQLVVSDQTLIFLLSAISSDINEFACYIS